MSLDQVQLKVKCNFTGHQEGWGANKIVGSVKLNTVATDDTPENKSFFVATPSGYMEFQTINEAALEFFAPGRSYIVTITPAKED